MCHFANRYGQTFLALHIAIGDFGLTNLYQTVRKITVTILLGGVGPLYIIGGAVALISAFALATAGLILAFSNLDLIQTTPILEREFEKLQPRIADLPDVVTLNSWDKIIMTTPERGEC